MKRFFFLVFTLLLLMESSAVCNPLFANIVKIVVKGDLEYCYDSNGNLLIREDVGHSGYLYNNNGEAFACFSGTDNPYDNVSALYYDLDGNYWGKCQVTSKTEPITGDELIVRTYLDHKNRPVATFVQKSALSSMADYAAAEKAEDVDAGVAAFMNMLGSALGNIGVDVGKTYVLSGRIQRYNN